MTRILGMVLTLTHLVVGAEIAFECIGIMLGI